MNKKQILFGALLGLPALAMADVKFTIDPVTIAPGDKGDMARTVTVNVELSEGSNLSTFDMLIDLPTGLTMKGTDYVNTTTDYGWSLTRSRQTDSQYKFVGYQKNNNHLKPAEGGAAKKVVAFTFEVEAADDFNPKTAGDITLHDVTVADMTDPVNNPTLKVQDDASSANTVYGDVVGINKLVGKDFYNPLWFDYLDKDGNAATCGDPNGYDADTEYKGNFNLTPKHTYHLTLNLDNSEKYDGLNFLGGDKNVRSIEGVFHLPKGVKVKSMTRTGRTLIEDPDLGAVYEEKGERLQKFSILATSAPLKNVAEYGTAILEFELEADNDFDVQQADILVDNFVAGKFGSSLRYTMEQEFTFTIDNPNQVAKDQKDTEIGKQGDPAAADGSLWQQYAAQVEAVHEWVKNCIAVTEQEKKAEDALNALAQEVLNQYQAGTLGDWTDPDKLQEKAEAEIAAIKTVYLSTLEDARAYDAAALAAINAEEPEIPGNVRNYSAIVPIKNVDDEGKGTLKDAKDALKTAVDNAKTNGTLGDNLDAINGKSLDIFIAAVTGTDPKGQIELLKDAIAEANAKAEANNQAAEDTKKDYALPTNCAEDDGEIGTSKNGTWYTAQKALDKAVTDAETAGTQADPDIYKTQIDDLIDAALVVETKAVDNNDAAEQAITDNALPTNVSQDDTQKTWTTAKEALDKAVSDAEKAGTQAKTDIYKEAIAALAAALQTVKDKADANNQLITDAQAEQDYQDALENCKDAEGTPGNNVNIHANKEYTDAVEAFRTAENAMFDKQTTAASEGTQAQDDIYKAEIKDMLAKAKALNEKVVELKATAAANEKAVEDELAINPVYPAGTGKNDSYDDTYKSPVLEDLVQKYADAADKLSNAETESIKQGLLADNKYIDAEGNEVSLADLIKEVQDARQALQDEMDNQSDTAAKNYDNQETLAGELLKLVSDVYEAISADEEWQDAKNVTDAWDAVQQAYNDVLNQYGHMVEDHVAGDPTETETLNELIDKLTNEENGLIPAYEQEVADAKTALADVDEMTADVDDLKKSFTDTTDDEVLSELEKAKVANPAEVANPAGQLPTTQAQYEELVGILNGYANAVQDKVDEVKADFLAGNMTKDEVETWMNETLPTLKEAAKEFTANKLVEYLQTVQRGDVNGDGRWTSADYAKIRKMILDEDYPEVTVEVDEFGHLQGITIEKDAEGKVVNTEAVYTFASFDVNQDGDINVGDAQGALNYAYYGAMTKPGAGARSNSNVAESLTAEMVGNRIAVSLTNSREYSALQMDVVLPEGMTIEGQSVADRNDGFSIAASQLKNGATRIIVTANEAGKAFAGNEGEVLYIDVNGQGTVSFENIIFADVNAGTQKFQLASVTGGIATGIAAAKSENGMMETIYNMGGRLMNGLKKGINIIRRADGTTEKVIKK